MKLHIFKDSVQTGTKHKMLGTPWELGKRFGRKMTTKVSYFQKTEWDVEVTVAGRVGYKAEFEAEGCLRGAKIANEFEVTKNETIPWRVWNFLEVDGDIEHVTAFKSGFQRAVIEKMNEIVSEVQRMFFYGTHREVNHGLPTRDQRNEKLQLKYFESENYLSEVFRGEE